MKINTIILIDKDQVKKQKFLEKLRKKMTFSYTKIEAAFETLMETFPEEFSKDKKENFLKFLNKFLLNLKEKNEISVIDIDDLSVKNTDYIMANNKNILAIYLEEKEDKGKALAINLENEDILEIILNEIKNACII